MTKLTREDFIKMIEEADGVDEVVNLRDMLESDEYEIESHLEMSSMVSFKESEYNL